jgi:6-phosphogluconolactonase
MTDRYMIEAYADASEASRAAAEAIADWLVAGLAEDDRASFVATGGSTPGEVYDLLSTLPLPWEHVSVTLSDERWVAPDSPESNERLLRERLLVGEAAQANFVPLWSDAANVAEAADAADPMVADLAPFDVVLLGMGEDGHIASLFPGNASLEHGLDLAGGDLVIPVPKGEPAPPQDRLSLTLYALRQSYLILVLIRGETKRRVIEEGEGLPIHALLDAAGETPVRIIWSP